MDVNRRTFLKTTLGTFLATGFPAVSLTNALSKSKNPIKQFRFHASKARVNLGVGPDFTAWTYNGRIPGPEIRVREGEIIRVVLKNYLPEGTTVHWHGLPVPNAMDGVPEVTQHAVMPGETFVYEFEARPAGGYIYHSHARYQLDQGLYGALIIEPSNPRESYDREYTLHGYDGWYDERSAGIWGKRNPSFGAILRWLCHKRQGLSYGESPCS